MLQKTAPVNTVILCNGTVCVSKKSPVRYSVNEALSLVHTSEISTSTSTNARHTHAQKWFGFFVDD